MNIRKELGTTLSTRMYEMGWDLLRHDYAGRAWGTRHQIELIHLGHQPINRDEIWEVLELLAGLYGVDPADMLYERYEQAPRDYRLAVQFVTERR